MKKFYDKVAPDLSEYDQKQFKKDIESFGQEAALLTATGHRVDSDKDLRAHTEVLEQKWKGMADFLQLKAETRSAEWEAAMADWESHKHDPVFWHNRSKQATDLILDNLKDLGVDVSVYLKDLKGPL